MKKKVYLVFQRYKFKSKSQPSSYFEIQFNWCIWCFKDTNSKANHNVHTLRMAYLLVYLVFQRYKFKSKSQHLRIWHRWQIWCIWCFKDTNSKANHNRLSQKILTVFGVFGVSKIQIQKQITTRGCGLDTAGRVYLVFQRYKFKSKSQPYFGLYRLQGRCIWCFKDTNSKANHNSMQVFLCLIYGVFGVSKIHGFL